MIKVDYAMEMKALLGDISQCGDLCFFQEYGDNCFMALIDVLGHGSEARAVAIMAEKCLQECYQKDLISVMNQLHEYLRGTRGAVASICLFNKETRCLSHVGIGNITVRLFGSKPTRMVSRDGVIGYGTIRPKASEVMLSPGDILMMHSDGIKEHFDAIECVGLLKGDAESITLGMMDKYGMKNDDSSCLILKLEK